MIAATKCTAMGLLAGVYALDKFATWFQARHGATRLSVTTHAITLARVSVMMVEPGVRILGAAGGQIVMIVVLVMLYCRDTDDCGDDCGIGDDCDDCGIGDDCGICDAVLVMIGVLLYGAGAHPR